ncbi:MAG: hypothetical protein QM204_00970 [Bacillota bacterium]|jgi:hypothetical protein|nr:hypothetical protein [Bacillota bacterium]NLL26280.1 hypothetical protein [Erysipelotrichia bacterium]
MNNKKRKKRLIIMLASLIFIAFLSFYMVFICGFYAASDKVVGPYTGSANIDKYLEYEAWQIGRNKYGQPIFVDSDEAFKLAQEKYSEAIILIYNHFNEEYQVGKFGKNNYQLYKMLGWQIPTDDETIRKSGVELTQFLDIYENSFKRWIYVPGFGWDRICP